MNITAKRFPSALDGRPLVELQLMVNERTTYVDAEMARRKTAGTLPPITRTSSARPGGPHGGDPMNDPLFVLLTEVVGRSIAWAAWLRRKVSQ